MGRISGFPHGRIIVLVLLVLFLFMPGLEVPGAMIGSTRVDALVTAQVTKVSPLKKFAMMIGPEQPEKLSIPLLWVSDYEQTGQWVV